ncbi:MAG: response regulator [Alphaproteobacteria bacterium]|nr:response regulator [Alphaproteobacteria bacterium]
MTSSGETMMAGRRVLLAEDEFIVVCDMIGTFEACGAEVVGPASSVAEALSLVEATEDLDGAVLDINLQGEMVYPVADALKLRGVPFVFATGYDRSVIREDYLDVPRCEKPVDMRLIVTALFHELDRPEE